MIALLSLYVTVTVVVAFVYTVLWAMEKADSTYFYDNDEEILYYARGFLTAPLWPLFLVRAFLALIADAMTSMKGNEHDESE